jgi:putative transposase
MPRGPRLDCPGSLHHLMSRGSEGQAIFAEDDDCLDFLRRLTSICAASRASIYAWALMPNHFHMLIRTGVWPLHSFVQRLITGFSVRHNAKYSPRGHVFMGRFKSILVEEDAYFLELVRYIHLNPLRAGLVTGFGSLEDYPWSGHSGILRGAGSSFQDVEMVLARFGSCGSDPAGRYLEFLAEGAAESHRPELVHGNLIIGKSGISSRENSKADQRRYGITGALLGSVQYARDVVADISSPRAGIRQRRNPSKAFAIIMESAKKIYGAPEHLVLGGSKRSEASAARRFVSICLVRLGYSTADAARLLHVTAQSVWWMQKKGLDTGERCQMRSLLEERFEHFEPDP